MKKDYSLLAAQILVALIIFAGGMSKLIGLPAAQQSFITLGLPMWFGYFIGIAEVSGAIGVFIRKLSALAAAGIAIIMVGAIYYHVAHTPLAQAIPATLVLICCGVIFSKRKQYLLKSA